MNLYFHKIPFVFITILTIVGVEIQNYFQFESGAIWLLFSSCFVLILIFFVFKKTIAFTVSCILGFFIIGALLLSERSPSKSHEISSSKSLIVKVLEVGSKKTIWSKAICQISDRKNRFPLLNAHKVVLFFESNAIVNGDVLIVGTELSLIKNKNNPGEFNAEKYWRSKGIDEIGFVGDGSFKFIDKIPVGAANRFFTNLRFYMSNILGEHIEGDQLSVANALILGDKDLLSAETRKTFSSAGAMHVLAVSGLHVGIVLYLLMLFFSQFPRVFSRKRALILALLLIWCYAGLTGFSPSVLRATIMFTILSMSTVIGRKGNNLNTLFFSAFLMLLWNPSFIYDIGFQLSYLAMIGIFTLYPPLSKLFYLPFKPFRWLWEGTAVGFAAQISTFPLTLYYFHQFPNFFLITNIGMMLLAGVCLSAGLVLSFIGKVTFLSGIVGYVTFLLFSIMLFFVQCIESIPGAVAKGFSLSEEMVLSLYAVLVLTIFFKERKRVVFIGAFGLIMLLAVIQFNRHQSLSRRELVVYNSNKLAITIKDGKSIHCFYDVAGETKIGRLIEDYEKTFPGEIIYHPLLDGITKFETKDNQLTFTQRKNGVELILNERAFFIRNSYNTSVDVDAEIIDMPYLQENPHHIQLNDGAFRVEIN